MQVDRSLTTARPRPSLARRGARTLATVALLIACASPALGFAPDEPAAPSEPALAAPRAPDVEAVLRGAATKSGEAKATVMERIGERLRRLPLRPVMIGDAPRTPDDPEPGAGITVFIRF